MRATASRKAPRSSASVDPTHRLSPPETPAGGDSPLLHRPPMKAAFQIALTVYGLAAVIALFVAALIQALFVVVRRFSR